MKKGSKHTLESIRKMTKFPKEKRKCLYCKKIFIVPSYLLKKFCSHSCSNKDKTGVKSPFWKGGVVKRKGNDYSRIYIGRKKYAQEHRYIMEKNIKRRLKKNEIVHHKNGIKNDNRPTNLHIFEWGEHTTYHNKNENTISIKC